MHAYLLCCESEIIASTYNIKISKHNLNITMHLLNSRGLFFRNVTLARLLYVVNALPKLSNYARIGKR